MDLTESGFPRKTALSPSSMRQQLYALASRFPARVEFLGLVTSAPSENEV